MTITKILAILEPMQMSDKDFEAKTFELHGAATFCPDCGKNTSVGRYPFWHRYSRTLCSSCGAEYTELLRALKAWDN